MLRLCRAKNAANSHMRIAGRAMKPVTIQGTLVYKGSDKFEEQQAALLLQSQHQQTLLGLDRQWAAAPKEHKAGILQQIENHVSLSLCRGDLELYAEFKRECSAVICTPHAPAFHTADHML